MNTQTSPNTGRTAADRRDETYDFASERSLLAFFTRSLPKPVVKDTVEAIRKKFVPRGGVSREEQKLQFLRKCEAELVKLSRQQMGLTDRV